MTGQAAQPSYGVGAWALLSRRLSPYVDGVLGVADRERELLVAVSSGLPDQEIAAWLHTGHGTVKTHGSHLLTHLESATGPSWSWPPTSRG
jgi:DNA-binding NarL/FixJ family response regulator